MLSIEKNLRAITLLFSINISFLFLGIKIKKKIEPAQNEGGLILKWDVDICVNFSLSNLMTRKIDLKKKKKISFGGWNAWRSG